MNQIHENYYPEEIFYDKNDEFYEGTITKITVNKHERNQEARKECIKYHGVKCKICGFDFEKKYGDIGKDFIHVHHIIPISSKIKLYKIDYKKDLIPVCPNCHAMLHRKNKNGNLYSPDELKLLLDNLNSNV
jgi:5-methylcytosine-specific restriction protein A